mmetsp:Transcript_82468/g.223463  ORF Transcript_82468/g.223463 Transcript_82468/m.223463 type:complete len:256 (-) Transcript_82468:122-889(-)
MSPGTRRCTGPGRYRATRSSGSRPPSSHAPVRNPSPRTGSPTSPLRSRWSRRRLPRRRARRAPGASRPRRRARWSCRGPTTPCSGARRGAGAGGCRRRGPCCWTAGGSPPQPRRCAASRTTSTRRPDWPWRRPIGPRRSSCGSTSRTTCGATRARRSSRGSRIWSRRTCFWTRGWSTRAAHGWGSGGTSLPAAVAGPTARARLPRAPTGGRRRPGAAPRKPAGRLGGWMTSWRAWARPPPRARLRAGAACRQSDP